MRQAILRLFERTFGSAPDSVIPVAADGSQRTYLRLRGGARRSVIGAYGPDPDENRAFLSFSGTFRQLGLPVPEIYATDETAGIWLAEDLGDATLFSELSRARAAAVEAAGEADLGGAAEAAGKSAEESFPAEVLPRYERVLELLPRFQTEGRDAIDFAVAYPRPAFDRQSMSWDLNYFKYHFLKLAHIPFNEQRLENDFDRLTRFLLQADGDYFLYRDFQSRNIMIRDGAPWFIDYQGGRRGALQYDVASLLYDAKAAVPEEVRERLLGHYLDALSEHLPVDRDRFRELYRGFVLIRVMQAMGAYGYRGFFERKPRFLESVPYAARNLSGIVASGLPVELPEIEAVFGRIAEAWAEGDPLFGPGGAPGLDVHISSFSYRHGLPVDDRGHGGGFVFDCRSLPNPGRSPEYAEVTGHDPDVVAFLEAAPEVGAFWDQVRALVEAHVENYRKRGFTDLSVAFGCTGGQHRSVYFSELLGRHLKERHPDVRVHVQHRERGRWPGGDRPSKREGAGDAGATTDEASGAPWTR